MHKFLLYRYWKKNRQNRKFLIKPYRRFRKRFYKWKLLNTQKFKVEHGLLKKYKLKTLFNKYSNTSVFFNYQIGHVLQKTSFCISTKQLRQFFFHGFFQLNNQSITKLNKKCNPKDIITIRVNYHLIFLKNLLNWFVIELKWNRLEYSRKFLKDKLRKNILKKKKIINIDFLLNKMDLKKKIKKFKINSYLIKVITKKQSTLGKKKLQNLYIKNNILGSFYRLKRKNNNLLKKKNSYYVEFNNKFNSINLIKKYYLLNKHKISKNLKIKGVFIKKMVLQINTKKYYTCSINLKINNKHSFKKKKRQKLNEMGKNRELIIKYHLYYLKKIQKIIHDVVSIKIKNFKVKDQMNLKGSIVKKNFNFLFLKNTISQKYLLPLGQNYFFKKQKINKRFRKKWYEIKIKWLIIYKTLLLLKQKYKINQYSKGKNLIIKNKIQFYTKYWNDYNIKKKIKKNLWKNLLKEFFSKEILFNKRTKYYKVKALKFYIKNFFSGLYKTALVFNCSVHQIKIWLKYFLLFLTQNKKKLIKKWFFKKKHFRKWKKKHFRQWKKKYKWWWKVQSIYRKKKKKLIIQNLEINYKIFAIILLKHNSKIK